MDAMSGLISAFVLAALAATFYGGVRYGRSAEQYVVAAVLARYRHVDAAAGVAVTSLLLRLKGSYIRAYTAVVDEVDQIAAETKKAL
jgi:hypothetical protein